HMDHSPAAAPLKAATGAPTYGFGPHGSGHVGGITYPDGPPRGADLDFRPDVALADGDIIEGTGWTLQAVHTPGHASNHLCFAYPEEATLFTGDHVMGWSTSVISPPDGDMGTYLDSLHKLLRRHQDAVYWPTHGPAVTDPRPHVKALIDHRERREDAILGAIGKGRHTVADITDHLYRAVPQGLRLAASRTVLSHLIHMVRTGRVACD
ncbi:MAG: MBL fold metallo-hydrolase, partial [Microthrixaceae bacterium]|nr:MBL fold metallo-hydrolase [Microthrixaceae bacterium]